MMRLCLMQESVKFLFFGKCHYSDKDSANLRKNYTIKCMGYA